MLAALGQVRPRGFWSHACFLKQMLETRVGRGGEKRGENLRLPAWHMPKPELGAEHFDLKTTQTEEMRNSRSTRNLLHYCPRENYKFHKNNQRFTICHLQGYFT